MVKIQKLRAVANGAFQLEVSDNEVVRPGARPNLLTLLNSDDSRFQNNARLAWIKTTPKMGNEYFGIPLDTFEDMVEGDEIELDIKNPEINGLKLRVEVKEATTPFDDYQKANTKRAAKSIEIKGGTLKSTTLKLNDNIDDSSIGQRAYFMSPEGELVYSKTEVVLGEPKHEFVDSSEFTLVLAGDIFEEEKGASNAGVKLADKEETTSTPKVARRVAGTVN